MGHDAGEKAAGAIGDEIVKRTGNERCRPIRKCMRESKSDRDDHKRKPAKTPEANRLKLFRNQKAQQKAAPKNFFNQGNDHDESKKAKQKRAPVEHRTKGKEFGIKSFAPGREVKNLLRCDPEKENEQPDRQQVPRLTQRMKFVIAAEEKEEGG